MSTREQSNVQVAGATAMFESAFDTVFCCYDSLAQEFPEPTPQAPVPDKSPRAERPEGVGSPPPPGRPDVEADLLAAYLDDARRCLGALEDALLALEDRKSTRLNSSHIQKSRMPSSA